MMNAKPRTLANLGDALGDPRGPNPTLQELMALNRANPPPGPNGPMPCMEQILQHLSMTGRIEPALYPVNQAAWEAFIASRPESLNIEDRRGINRRR